MTDILGMNFIAFLLVFGFIAVVIYVGSEVLPKVGEDEDENPDDPKWWSGV